MQSLDKSLPFGDEARLGICSQRGNMSFPAWEHSIPSVGTFHSQRGNIACKRFLTLGVYVEQ